MKFEEISENKQRKKKLDKVFEMFKNEFENSSEKESVYKKYVAEYHERLVCLPFPFQIAEAKKWVGETKEFQSETDKTLFSENELAADEYIEKISGIEADFNAEFEAIKKDIESEKNEIIFLLSSKEFKRLYMFSSKKNKMKLRKFFRYLS